MKTHNVSGSRQVFALLVLSQCFWLLCSRPPLQNGLLTVAASAAAYGVVFLLVVLCCRPTGQTEKQTAPRWFSLCGALLAVGYFSVTASQLLSAARVVFEGAFSPLWLLLTLLAAVLSAAAAGQEALGRAAFICLFLFLAAALLLAVGVLPQAAPANLRMPERDLSRLGGQLLQVLSYQAEPLLLLALAPYTDRSHRSALLLWSPAGWAVNAAFLLLSALALGHYGSLQAYPLHQLARSAGLSGMVPVYCFLLVTAAFFRLTGLAVAALRFGGGVMTGHKPLFCCTALLCLGGVVLLYYTGWQNSAVYGVLGIAGLLWLVLYRVFAPSDLKPTQGRD